MFIFKFFFIGIVECFGGTLNIKFVQKNRKILSFITSYLNIMIWLYIIDTMPKVEGILVRQAYAFGFALADVFAIMFENKLDVVAKRFGAKWRKHKKRVANRKK